MKIGDFHLIFSSFDSIFSGCLRNFCRKKFLCQENSDARKIVVSKDAASVMTNAVAN